MKQPEDRVKAWARKKHAAYMREYRRKRKQEEETHGGKRQGQNITPEEHRTVLLPDLREDGHAGGERSEADVPGLREVEKQD